MDELQKRIQDLYRRAKINNKVYKSDFFKATTNICVQDGIFFGGFEGSERVAYFAMPTQMCSIDFDEYIKCIKILPNDKKKYSHSDYLGSILALQIDRDKIGDIIVFDDCAYIVGFDVAINFIYNNLQRISSTGCKIERVRLCDIPNSESMAQELVVSCSSMRLDCVISACFKISREKAKTYIESGYVKLANAFEKRCEKQVSIADVISVRGLGRVVIIEHIGASKKGKIRLRIKK